MKTKKFLAGIISFVLALGSVMIPVSADENSNYVTVTGIVGFEDKKYANPREAYDEISAFIAEKSGLGQEPLKSGVEFSDIFTQNGDITWTVYGNQTFDETGRSYLISFGRKAAHFSDANHITNIKIVGGNGDKSDTVTFATDLSYPYEWWSSNCPNVSVSLENLTLNSTNTQNKICFYQSYTYKLDYSIKNCNVNAFVYYYCNASGSITIEDSVFTGTQDITYALHAQGHETEPLNITFTGNTVSGYKRGINIDQNTANVVISGNTFTPGIGYSAVQLSGCKNAEITGNTVYDNGNVITLHEKLAQNEMEDRVITVSNNVINAVDGVQGYLVYDDISAEGKYEDKKYFTLNWEDNVVDEGIITDKGVKGSSVYDLTTYVEDVVAPKEEITWTSVTDAGYYMITDTKYGMMRFLFAVDAQDATIDSVGIKYTKSSDIAANMDGKIVSGTTTDGVFYGDITSIPETESNASVYAMAYAVIDGKPIWSAPVSCKADFERHFKSFDK